MMKKSLVISTFVALSLTLSAGHVLAHTSIVTEFSASQRSVADGTRVINDFSIPHGCNGESVKATTILFPNAGDLVAEDQDGNAVSAEEVYAALEDGHNIIMGPKPTLDPNWRRQEVLTGPVPTYNSHGSKDMDVRAFVYNGGNLPTEFLSLSRWRAKFAGIKDDSCVKAIEVRIPVVNYCGRNPNSDARMDAWIGRPTALFNDNNGEVLSDGYWPRLMIENTGYTGLDATGAECVQEKMYKVSPSDADIDMYLPLRGYIRH